MAPYKFRWWSDYSSQMGNWGVHFMDVIRWLMGETAPVAVFAHLANMALTTRERLHWDPETERFTNSATVNELLHYEYRSEWKMFGL
jgi:predicted dehydrogenase